MLTQQDLKQLCGKLSCIYEQTEFPFADEEIQRIVYHKDRFECADVTIINKHIDIDLRCGEFIEIGEADPLYSYICELANQHIEDHQEGVVLYEK